MRRNTTGRRMLQAMFFIPILALARAMPIVRTIVPPMSLVCAPKTCSTRVLIFGFGPVAALRLRGQRLAALALAVDVALQFPIPQPGLHFLRATGRVHPDAGAGVLPRISRESTAWLSCRAASVT